MLQLVCQLMTCYSPKYIFILLIKLLIMKPINKNIKIVFKSTRTILYHSIEPLVSDSIFNPICVYIWDIVHESTDDLGRYAQVLTYNNIK